MFRKFLIALCYSLALGNGFFLMLSDKLFVKETSNG